MLQSFKKSGFTIVEVVVSSAIFAIAALGIFSTVAMIRKPGAVSERKISAAYYGKRILDDLRAKVDQATWNTGPLAVGVYAVGPTTIDGTAYSGTYTVTNDASGARRVQLLVSWTEP